MKGKIIDRFFKDLPECMRFFLEARKWAIATDEGSCMATLEKEEDKWLYALEWIEGGRSRYVAEYVRPFRPSDEGLRLFNDGCAEMARRLRIYVNTDDVGQVPETPPAFGILSCESPDKLAPRCCRPLEEPVTETARRKYFPAVQKSRTVKRYDAGSYEMALLTDVTCAGLVQCTHLLVAVRKGDGEPCCVVAAEADNLGSRSNRSHFLCIYPGSGHRNLGQSDECADLTHFERKARELMEKELGIRIPTG